MNLKLDLLSNKKYKFRWSDHDRSVLVEVTLPDLKKLNFKGSGDWGPTYTFELDDHDPLDVKYDNKSIDIAQEELRIESPVLATEREVYPHILVVEDWENQVEFNLYLDRLCTLGMIDIKRKPQRMRALQKRKIPHLRVVG